METIKNLPGLGSSSSNNDPKENEATRPVLDFSDPASFQSNLSNPGSQRAIEDTSHPVSKPASYDATDRGFQSNSMYGGDSSDGVAKPQEYKGEKGFQGNAMYAGEGDGEVAKEHGVGKEKEGVVDKIAGVVTSHALGGAASK